MKTSILTLLIISFVASPVFSQERYKKTIAPLTETEKSFYFTKKQREADARERKERKQIEQRFELPCLPYWVERNELNVYRLRCPKP